MNAMLFRCYVRKFLPSFAILGGATVFIIETLMVLFDRLFPFNLVGGSNLLRCLGSVWEFLSSSTDLFTNRLVDLLNLPSVLCDLQKAFAKVTCSH